MTALARRNRRTTNIWPGFVDALATLLMVIIFLLMVFVLAQFFLGEALSGRDAALDRLRNQVGELSELLALERKAGEDLRLNVMQLSTELRASLRSGDDLRETVRVLTERAEGAEGEAAAVARQLEETRAAHERDLATLDEQARQAVLLQNQIAALEALKAELEREAASMATQVEETDEALIEERRISESARAQIALLNQQVAALRQQIGELSEALDVSEALAKERGVQIANLGKRLNTALAGKVQELARYRSEFFGRLREALGDRPDIRIVGDRFVLQSEVLFASGEAELGEVGKAQLVRVAETLAAIGSRIPEEVDWVLRVDGHTDNVPIYNNRFTSNWQLSAARALSVVNVLIDAGIPPRRLAATGFGEYRPIDPRGDEIGRRRNRRIELKLTQP